MSPTRAAGPGFTYPPFAALVFTPLSWLPFGIAVAVMQVLTAGLMFAGIGIALRMIGVAATPRRVALCTAAAVWAEPVRLTSDYGQINVVLVFLVLLAAYLSRSGASGALAGVAAGIKLTPAITAAYFLLSRRYWAVVWTVVSFVATVGVSMLVVPRETRLYFTTLVHDTSRIGPATNVVNQSLRGAVSRFAGTDIGGGPVWLIAVALAAVVCGIAFYAVHRRDPLIGLIVVQLFALLSSPISWAHHWVWAVLLVVWLRFGALRSWRPARVMSWLWIAYLLLGCNIFEITARALGSNDGDFLYGVMTCPEVLLTVATLALLIRSRDYVEPRGESGTHAAVQSGWPPIRTAGG
ncbi:glycosyltransferase 87 family protein [Tsukamurella paurometabola]|uniref:glycosyltransferase 87 family protein n=1 Tax=Tsukamurella paurometabola TaxID=2061 RepID=UPI00165156D2|nr:glycosyltransferase 87 family protein [Tsukamurella paurometabola]